MSSESADADLETQIRQARERAENFASSLNRAREQENKFEEERQKWMQSFEEKSILVEQLERELAATVDALNKEKEDKVEVSRQIVRPVDSGHTATVYDYPAPVTASAAAPRVSHEYVDAEDQSANKRILELLKQSQEETAQVRKELVSVRAERDRLADQVAVMKRQVERLTQDREELLISIKNTDGKLQFRAEQLTNYEIDKERFAKKEAELNELVAELDKKLKLQNSEILVASTDLRAAKTYNESLEQRIAELNNKLLSTAGPSLAMQKKIDDMERVAIELTVRAEEAESALRVFMDAQGKTGAAGQGQGQGKGGDVHSPSGWREVHKQIEDGIQKSKSSQDKLQQLLSEFKDDDSPIRLSGTVTGAVLDMADGELEEKDSNSKEELTKPEIVQSPVSSPLRKTKKTEEKARASSPTKPPPAAAAASKTVCSSTDKEADTSKARKSTERPLMESTESLVTIGTATTAKSRTSTISKNSALNQTNLSLESANTTKPPLGPSKAATAIPGRKVKKAGAATKAATPGEGSVSGDGKTKKKPPSRAPSPAPSTSSSVRARGSGAGTPLRSSSAPPVSRASPSTATGAATTATRKGTTGAATATAKATSKAPSGSAVKGKALISGDGIAARTKSAPAATAASSGSASASVSTDATGRKRLQVQVTVPSGRPAAAADASKEKKPSASAASGTSKSTVKSTKKKSTKKSTAGASATAGTAAADSSIVPETTEPTVLDVLEASNNEEAVETAVDQPPVESSSAVDEPAVSDATAVVESAAVQETTASGVESTQENNIEASGDAGTAQPVVLDKAVVASRAPGTGARKKVAEGKKTVPPATGSAGIEDPAKKTAATNAPNAAEKSRAKVISKSGKPATAITVTAAATANKGIAPSKK